mgnify:FL=1
MRAQLQSEIRRTFESSAEQPSDFRWILALWPRFAFGAAILGLLMVAAFWNSGTGRSNQSFQVASESSTRSAPSAPATGGAQANRLNLEDADKAAQSAPEKPLDSGRSGALEPQRLLSELPTNGTVGELVSDTKLELALAESVPAEVGLSAVAAPLSETNTVSFTRLNSSDRYRRNFNSPPYPEILQSFEAVVQGTSLRIIDTDGSVYTGTIQAGVGFDRTAGKAAAGSVAAGQAESSPAFGFRVTGRSRSLNQPVVLTGTVVDTSVTPTGRGSAHSRDLGGILGNGRIQGTARIGTRQEFPLEAVRKAP